MEQIKSIDKALYKVVQAEGNGVYYLDIIDKSVAKSSGNTLAEIMNSPSHPSRLCAIQTKDLALYDKIVTTLNNLI